MIFLWLPVIVTGLLLLYNVVAIAVTVVRNSRDSFDKLVVLHAALIVVFFVFLYVCWDAYANTRLG